MSVLVALKSLAFFGFFLQDDDMPLKEYSYVMYDIIKRSKIEHEVLFYIFLVSKLDRLKPYEHGSLLKSM